MEEAITWFILSDPTVGSIVGNRVSWVTLPQGVTLPAVVLTLIDSVPEYSNDLTENKLTQSRLQIDVWALDYATAKLGARAIFTLLSAAYVANANNTGIEFQAIYKERDVESFEQGTGNRDLWRVSQDYQVWHVAN